MNEEEKCPIECATCEHYDNMEGVCCKFHAYVHFSSKCKHYELCKEFKGD